MIIKGKDVIGLKVVTVDTGTVIQTVDDIAYDPTDHRITALLVDSGGLFSSAKAIHIDDVRNIGEDAVIVHDESAIKSTKDLSSDVRSISDSNKHLVKTNVLTIDGKELGKVTDIFFDSETGYVETMEVSQGGLKTMTEGKKSIKPSDIVTIGADATIVSTYTEAVLDAQGEEGGLKGMLNDAKSKTEAFAENAKESIQSATDKTVEATKDAAENVKEKSLELKDKAAEKAEDLREDTARQAERVRSTVDEKAAEARTKANEMKDDVVEKSNELAATAESKANELKIAASEKRDDVEVQASELSDEILKKSKNINATAREKAEQTKSKISNVASKAKEDIAHETENIKDTTRDQIDSAHHTGDTLVKKASKVYKDKDEVVTTHKTSVKKV